MLVLAVAAAVRLERERTLGRNGREQRRRGRWCRERGKRGRRRHGRRHGWGCPRRHRRGQRRRHGRRRPRGTGGGASGFISTQYPRDVAIASDPRVLFASDFENGLAGWTRYTNNTDQITVLTDAALAHAGTQFLRAQVTRTQLAANANISANAQYEFATRVPEVYWRFHARFVGQTASPHHWVRVGAGTPSYQSDGLANTVPPGNQGFWFDLDASQGKTFAFYAYWYKMRSGRCNDGSATPGCAGDQGTTYYYGNNFNPAGQTAFAADSWFCLEIHAKANTVGQSDGELTLWKDDALVGEYKPGTPRGRWLRDNFYSWGQYYVDEQAFEGFDFRSDANVLLKRVTLDAYYQVDTPARLRPGRAGDPLRRRGRSRRRASAVASRRRNATSSARAAP